MAKAVDVIVIRFKVQCQPDRTAEFRAALVSVIAPSRAVPGVVSFDLAQDLADPTSFIATEVLEDSAARERLEGLPELGQVMSMLASVLSAPPEATVFHVSSHEAAM